MINYATTVSSMYVDNTQNLNITNLVIGLEVILTGTDDSSQISANTKIYIRIDPGSDIIQFADLTDEIVSGWINESSFLNDAKVFVEKQIAEKKSNALGLIVNPPWVTYRSDPFYTTIVDTNSFESKSFRAVEIEASVQRVLGRISGGTI